MASIEVIRERVAARLIEAVDTTTRGSAADPHHKRAAVAIVVREGAGGPQVLLIRRAERPGDAWSGHMAFPGGREDPGDESLAATAIRETFEELALDLRQAGRLLGQLAPLPAMAHGRPVAMTIVPFVFELTTADAELHYSDEVVEALWVPLAPLAEGHLRTTFAVDRDGAQVRLPAHDVDGRIVWGLTYRMLDSLLGLLR